MSPSRKSAQQRHDEAVARLIDARSEQGLEPTITAPATLDAAATLFHQEPQNAK